MSPEKQQSFFQRNLIWIILAAVVLWGVSMYNGLVTSQEGVEGQWGNVENAYKRRADLIPNLVNTVKGYAEHEQETFIAVVEARAKATQTTIDPTNVSPEQMAAYMEAQNGVSSALSRLLVVVENYPDLKANQNFLALQTQLEGTENRISTERRKYNEDAKIYNAKRRKFPVSMFANMFGFDDKPYFEAPEGAEDAPDVNFD